MNNQFAIDMLVILQTLNLIMLYRERYNVIKMWKEKTISRRLFFGRMFMILLPALTIASLIRRPL